MEKSKVTNGIEKGTKIIKRGDRSRVGHIKNLCTDIQGFADIITDERRLSSEVVAETAARTYNERLLSLPAAEVAGRKNRQGSKTMGRR
jgi:hypothetical protein